MPPEVEEEQRQAPPETPEGTTPEEGAEGEGEGKGGEGEQSERLYLGKYKSVDELEKGAGHALEKLVDVQSENADLRERVARFEAGEGGAQHGAPGQTPGATPGAGEKTGGPNSGVGDMSEQEFEAEYNRIFSTGNYYKAGKMLAQREATIAQRPILDRVASSETDRLRRDMNESITTRMKDPKGYPGYKELEGTMHEILEDRTKRNPNYGLSFGSSGEMLDDIYMVARSRRADLVPKGAGAMVRAGGGFGSGGRTGSGGSSPAPKPKSKSKIPDESWKKFGMTRNRHQDQLSPEDQALAAEEAARQAVESDAQPALP